MNNSDKAVIRQIVGALHVSQPARDAARAVARRIDGWHGVERGVRATVIRYARHVHRDNGAFYQSIMGR